MRLFLALDLDEVCRDQLMAVAGGLGLGREVPEENLHLTLAFLDDQPSDVAEALHELLCGLYMPLVPLRSQELALFGGRSPSAVVLLMERVPELLALQGKVAQAARMAGVDLTRKRFKPHVTLIRLPRGLPPEAQQRLQGFMGRRPAVITAEAQSFSLVASVLTPDGPRYEVLETYPLGQ